MQAEIDENTARKVPEKYKPRHIRFSTMSHEIDAARGDTPFSRWVKDACRDKLNKEARKKYKAKQSIANNS